MSQCGRTLVKLPQSVTVVSLCRIRAGRFITQQSCKLQQFYWRSHCCKTYEHKSGFTDAENDAKILLEALASTFATNIQIVSNCEWSVTNSLKMLEIT